MKSFDRIDPTFEIATGDWVVAMQHHEGGAHCVEGVAKQFAIPADGHPIILETDEGDHVEFVAGRGIQIAVNGCYI